MRKLKSAVVAAALISTALAGAPYASAATEVGHTNCVANRAAESAVPIFQTALAGGGVQLTAPSAGVVTKWKLNVIPLEGLVVSQRVQVFRPTGAPNQFQVAGESTDATVTGGLQTFETRITVAAGDSFGLFGPSTPGTLYCETENPLDRGFGFPGAVPVGGTQTFVEIDEIGIPVAVVIEPDADKDGFGDESQDKCPQSAAIQAACPVLALAAVAPKVGRGSVSVLVAASSEAPITVKGTVKLPGGAKKARISAQAKLSAPAKTVAPGSIVSFKLKFTKALRSALAGLPSGKSLKLKVTATGANVAGTVSTANLTVKLKGQAEKP